MSIDLTAKDSLAESLTERIRSHTATVAIVHLGKVGLGLAEAAASAGFSVMGFDEDPERIKQLRTGRSYLNDVTSHRISELVHGGRVDFVLDPFSLRTADVLVFCVPLTVANGSAPDAGSLRHIAETVGPYLRRGQLVIVASTLFPGTTEGQLLPILEQGRCRAGRDFFLACSPERLGPDSSFTTRHAPRVVAGVNALSQALGLAFREALGQTGVPVSSLRAAEASRLLEITLRAANAAQVRELQTLLAAQHVSFAEVMTATGLEPPPFEVAGERRSTKRQPSDDTALLQLTSEILQTLPTQVVACVERGLARHDDSLLGSRICMLGLGQARFAEGPEDSSGRAVIDLLRRYGAHVTYHDAVVPRLALNATGDDILSSEPLTVPLLEAQDGVVIVSDSPAYNPDWIVRHSRLVVDARNVPPTIVSGRK